MSTPLSSDPTDLSLPVLPTGIPTSSEMVAVGPRIGFEESPAERTFPSANRFHRFLRNTLGVDRAILFTVLARGWTSLAGLLTLTLIARFLSPAEQGYYYTFYPLVNLQIVFELGFSVVLLQTASHEAAHLQISPGGAIVGPERHHGRLASAFQKALRWYSAAAVLMLAILLPAGYSFFAKHTTPGQTVHWAGPWVLAALATTLTFQIDPVFSFLEGCGQVPEVAHARLAQAITGSLLGWSALFGHHGLYAPGVMIGGQALAGSVFLVTRRGLLLPLLHRRVSAAAEQVSWRADLWPFQWRMAISWICGYFTLQLITPVLFARWGAVEAGRMGMSLNLAGALSAVAVAWMNTKAAPFGRLIALRRFGQLDALFFSALRQSTAISFCGAFAVWAGDLVLRRHGYALAHRLLAPMPLALLLLGAVGNNIVSGEAMYLRAHKHEKFMLNSLVGALYATPMVLVLGRSFGAAGIAAGYLAGTLVIGLGFGTFTFQKYRRLWHG